MDFEKVANQLALVATSSGRLAKENLLYAGRLIDGFIPVLKHLYNPYITTGIKQASLAQEWETAETYKDAGEVLLYYSQSRTGTSVEIAKACAFIDSWETETARWLAEGLFTKDLKCGVSTTTLNNLFGKGFIPVIGIMRGKQAPEAFVGKYIATEKIDGNRRLFFNTYDGVITYTRSGKRDYGLKQIEEEIAKTLPQGMMYDCECIAMGDFKDSIALRQASASILNSQSSNKTGVKALCFDMVPISDYDMGQSKSQAKHRKAALATCFGDTKSIEKLFEANLLTAADADGYLSVAALRAEAFKRTYITSLPILDIVLNSNQALETAKPIWESGGEGLMLVDANSYYVVSATPKKEWLKIKYVQEVVAKCIDIYPGEVGKKYENTLGGITVAFLGPDKKAYQCNCGSGFPDYLRDSLYANPEQIIGKYVELDCFGFSVSATTVGYSLNCPIFKRIRGEGHVTGD